MSGWRECETCGALYTDHKVCGCDEFDVLIDEPLTYKPKSRRKVELHLTYRGKLEPNIKSEIESTAVYLDNTAREQADIEAEAERGQTQAEYELEALKAAVCRYFRSRSSDSETALKRLAGMDTADTW